MQCYFRDIMQNAGTMNMQGQSPIMNTQGASPIMNTQGQSPMMNTQGQSPAMNMTQPQLESMYPSTYNIIQPHVENMCNQMEAYKGKMHCPSKEEMDKMVDHIYNNVEGEVEAAVKESPTETERQFYGGGRRVLRDLIGILLISSLIRRRRPFYPYPGFYGGYSPYGGYFY